MSEHKKEPEQTIAHSTSDLDTSRSSNPTPTFAETEQTKKLKQKRIESARKYFPKEMEFFDPYLNAVEKVQSQDREGVALEVYSQSPHQEAIVQLILRVEKNPDHYLISGCKDDNIQTLLLALINGANPNINFDGTSPLLHICAKLTLKLPIEPYVALLIAAGSNVTFSDAQRFTPLIYAATHGHHRVVLRLLKGEGRRVLTQENAAGDSALICAAREGHTEIARTLASQSGIFREATNATLEHLCRHIRENISMRDKLLPIIEQLLQGRSRSRKEKIISLLAEKNVSLILTAACQAFNFAVVEDVLSHIKKKETLQIILNLLCASLNLSEDGAASLQHCLEKNPLLNVIVIPSSSSSSSSSATTQYYSFEITIKEDFAAALTLSNPEDDAVPVLSITKDDSIPKKPEIKYFSQLSSSFKVETTLVDCIFAFPKQNSHDAADQVLAIDDLHGNFFKALRFLVEENIISLDKKNWEYLVTLHQKFSKLGVAVTKSFNDAATIIPEKDLLSKEELQEFTRIIKTITLTSYRPKVIFIGDELCDRDHGSPDYFNLALFQALKALGLDVKIIFSNHGCAFMQAWEGSDTGDRGASLKAALKKKPPFDIPQQFASLLGLQHLLEKRLVNPEEVNLMVADYYSLLQPFDYRLSQDDQEITIFSHAPTDHFVIEEVAEVFGVKYVGTSAIAIALSLENINKAFQEKNKKELLKLLQNNPKSVQALDQLIWTRSTQGLPSEWGHHNGPSQVAVQIINVHGHTHPVAARIQKHTKSGIWHINLHTKYGMPEHSSQDYVKLVSRDHPLTPEKRATAELARSKPEDKATMCIPAALPISYQDDMAAALAFSAEEYALNKMKKKRDKHKNKNVEPAAGGDKPEKRKRKDEVDDYQSKKNKTKESSASSSAAHKMLAERSRLFPPKTNQLNNGSGLSDLPPLQPPF